MNLCGGFTGVSEEEFVLQIPDEEYSVSSRKKSSSSSSSANRIRSASSSSRQSSRYSRGSRSMFSSQSSIPRSAMLNPGGKGDYEKFKTRHRVNPSREMKSSSILLKKLDSGFNLTWINGQASTQTVNLSLNSDKSYIRIRMRSKNEEESENDGSNMNQRDIKIKVRHIAKVGTEKDSFSLARRDDKDLSQENHFVIKLKHSVDQGSKFTFVAQSLAERDTIILAIRSLIIDQGRQSQASRSSSRDRSTEYRKVHSEDANEKALKALKITDQSRETKRESIRFENDSLLFEESRDDNGIEREKDSERDAVVDKFDHSVIKNPYARERSVDKVIEISTYKPSRNRSYMNHRGSINKIVINRYDSEEGSQSLQQLTTKRLRYDKQRSRSQSQSRSRSPRMLERPSKNRLEKDRSRSEIRDPPPYESATYDQTFSVEEDGDIASLAASCTNQATAMASLAAGFTNQTTGPWCTDDVCTASLRDFADSMTGIFELKHNFNRNEMETDDRNERDVAEEYISGFLSTNPNMGELLSVRDLWNVATTKHATGKELKRLHNRARNPDSRAKRFKNLRKQMTFQGADMYNIPFLQTVSSFDDVARRRNSEDSDLLFYDSDPEDVRERNQKRGPRLAVALLQEASSESDTKRREVLDILDNSRFGLGRKWKRLGQEVLIDIIEATKNEKLTLIWHPTQTDEKKNMAPVCVKVWVESGVYLADGTFLLPKLTWLPAHEGNLDVRVLNVSDNTPGSIELLDVCRVRECQSVDRRVHPFAPVERSFLIQTQTGSYLFETQSKQERGRVVNGLKLVIARLASLLMLRDLRAVDEFFGGNAVPGEAPVWARSNERNGTQVEFPTS
mmetsp:Transcript_18918/g.52828  ORF Transcript_18918/g.52828 Transcript_18918/m.52828 type:complete len:850 (+) Transcript_18918:111-2660(+)